MKSHNNIWQFKEKKYEINENNFFHKNSYMRTLMIQYSGAEGVLIMYKNPAFEGTFKN